MGIFIVTVTIKHVQCLSFIHILSCKSATWAINIKAFWAFNHSKDENGCLIWKAAYINLLFRQSRVILSSPLLSSYLLYSLLFCNIPFFPLLLRICCWNASVQSFEPIQLLLDQSHAAKGDIKIEWLQTVMTLSAIPCEKTFKNTVSD